MREHILEERKMRIMNRNARIKFRRIFVIVTDSMGIGAMKDAFLYNDEDANTFGHIASYSKEFKAPMLEKLGIGNICINDKIKKIRKPLGLCMRMSEARDRKSVV